MTTAVVWYRRDLRVHDLPALAAAVREHVLSRPRLVSRIRKTFAATFVLLGGRLALESR